MTSISVRRLVPVLLVLSAACLGAAPLIMLDGYSIVANTTSESAAQATEGAWLARTGFLLFGFAVLWLSVVRSRWHAAGRRAHMTFGVAMVVVAVYSHRPFLEDVPFDRIEDMFHSLAATGMGFAFAIGVAIVAYGRRSERVRLRDVAALVASIAIPIAMTWLPDLAGVMQRLMFAIAMWWYGAEAMLSRSLEEVDATVA